MSKSAKTVIALFLILSMLTLPGCMSTSATSISQASTSELDATKPSDNTTSTLHKYFDYTWRKEQAIYGLYNWIQWDTTGDISVYLDGNAVYTFVENF